MVVCFLLKILLRDRYIRLGNVYLSFRIIVFLKNEEENVFLFIVLFIKCVFRNIFIIINCIYKFVYVEFCVRY